MIFSTICKLCLSCSISLAIISFDNARIFSQPAINSTSKIVSELASKGLKSSPPLPKKRQDTVAIVRAFKFPKNGSACQGNICRDAVVRGEVLKAIVPRDENNADNLFGITYAEFPTFWLYFADQSQITSERPVNVRFVLMDHQTNTTVYQTIFQLTGGTGIFHFQLPETAPSLQIGKLYYWQFQILYGENNENIWVSEGGLIERQSPPSTLLNQLEQASPLDRVILYGENGIWHEMFTELAELRRLKPNDPEIEEFWSSLLDRPDIMLSSLKAQPLTSCCSVAK